MMVRRFRVPQVIVASGLYLLALCSLAGIAIGIHTLRGKQPNQEVCNPLNGDCRPKRPPNVRPDGEV